MSSAVSNDECYICESELEPGRAVVTTECGHTFHRDCAQTRLDAKQKGDCRRCSQKSAITKALTEQPAASTTTQQNSSYAETKSNKEKSDYAAASSVLTESPDSDNEKNDWECQACSIENVESTDRCASCGQLRHSPSIKSNEIPVTTSDQAAGEQESQRNKETAEYHDQTRGRNAPLVNSAMANEQQQAYIRSSSNKSNHSDGQHAEQQEERYHADDEVVDSSASLSDKRNLSSKDVPSDYIQQSDAAPSPLPSSIPSLNRSMSSAPNASWNLQLFQRSTSYNAYEPSTLSKIEYPRISSEKQAALSTVTKSIVAGHSKTTKTSSKEPASQTSTLVYIADLPIRITDSTQLENQIRHGLESILQKKTGEIKCYTNLGVGYVHVDDDETKNRLIDSFQNMTLNFDGEKTTISFVDELNLTSYIVLEVDRYNKDAVLPTPDEISRRCVQLYQCEPPRVCEVLTTQFPNIYKIVVTSLNDILKITRNPQLTISGRFGQMYCCADCSFLEGLPRPMTTDKLRQTIERAIQQPYIHPLSIAVQLNQQTNNACVIVTDVARMWSALPYLDIDGKILPRKHSLTSRLRIYPVIPSFDIQKIIDHPELAGKVVYSQQRGDGLILELNDKQVFDRYVVSAMLNIDDQTRFHVEPYVAASDPDADEIDEKTWYETEMLRYKADIMQFVAEPNHEIFHYKWNPQIWLKQFQSTLVHDQNGVNIRDRRNTPSNQTRHQLRVTVMLNTLAVVRKKSYRIENQEVKLNISDQMKTIVYDHRSKLERGGKLSFTKAPYTSTYVDVTNEDCLVAYERLVKKGHRPLLLNMANATTPGGGYRKGDGAQEENLFRRSDYFRSLDVGLDQWLPSRSERFHCSSNCQFDPLSDHNQMYSIHEYGAIYTSGLTVFRKSEDVGYTYMEKPLEGVCAIATAAYRDPKLEGNMLTSKYAVGTRKKIENVFAIAVHHKHDCLVLSAFGCGAFRNPPNHMAKIFDSVIDQYAGFFKMITFAIIDDHNAGHQINPEGNFQPFKDVLDGRVAVPLKPDDTPHSMFGPYQLLSNDLAVGDVCIYDKVPCRYGAECRDIYNRKHTQEFSHPLLCPYQSAKKHCEFQGEPVHVQFFIHKIQCQYGGECREIDEEKHSREYEHPLSCSKGETCNDMSKQHLKEYRHLPLCSSGPTCLEFQKHTPSHCQAYRHCTPNCLYGNHCADFHDKEHRDQFNHPFPTTCQFTPFHCHYYLKLTEKSTNHQQRPHDVQQHCLNFAHVCRFGRNCTDDNALHREKSIHIARQICPDGDQCKKLSNEDHLNSFTHADIPDIRELCQHADHCYDRRDLSHIKKYRHAMKFEHSGILSYFHLNKRVDFVRNQRTSIERVMAYVQDKKWKPLPSKRIPREIMNWIRTVQPVHRCNPVIFESILLHGHVMSREYMENLRKPKFVANAVLQHSRIRRISGLHEPTMAQQAMEFILALVMNRFEQKGFSPDLTTGGTTTHLSGAYGGRAGSASDKSDIQKYEKYFSNTLKTNDLDAIRNKVKEIADASINLHTNPLGIGFTKDKELGTDRTVFSILGPNLGHYYGDIIIVFKRTILHHPDASFSIQAATSYLSGSAFQMRPWLGTDPGSSAERVKLYHYSKLNASIPGYDYAAALELMALTSHDLKLKSMDITMMEILERWIKVDSHTNIEGHLPPLIPLSYIDHIYIPRNLYEQLSSASLRSINANFKLQHTVVPHDGEADQPRGPHGPTPSSKSRAAYQQFVSKELFKTYREHMKHPPSRPVKGAAITIASTNFTDYYILPLTISQAYDQYCSAKKHAPPDQTFYIYWQTSSGDMMLTLSNRPIGSETKQTDLHCLTCYIGLKPSTSHSSYFEQNCSYLDNNLPHRHHILMKSGRFAAKSNTFYVGCNTDDFMTFCLEIQRSTGTVTLMHAGPNAIYNHEKISHVFQRTQFDLTKLNYIHVSSGSLTVPVRNLMVCFEKQMDLHPTFDKHFKAPSSVPSSDHPPQPKKRERSDDDRKAANNDEKNPGILGQLKNFLFGDNAPELTPCRDNVNCPLQYSSRHAKEHNVEYSHPCRFSELCYNRETHLTHESHQVPQCKNDQHCSRVYDPFHRAEFRHKDLPDFLIPCRYASSCRDLTNTHRIKYSHGENVYHPQQPVEKEARASPSPYHHYDRGSPRLRDPNPEDVPRSDEGGRRKYPCKYGASCHDHSDPHLAKYSHQANVEPHDQMNNQRLPCEHGKKCLKIGDAGHRARYFHHDSSH